MGKVEEFTTRRERVESKEAAIVKAAYEMFATKGYAKSTMSDIAKAAGVAEGTVYLYFNNKEALASGVIASFYDRLTTVAEEGTERLKTTKARLEFLALHHLESVLEERRILQLLSILDRDADTYHGGEIYKMNKRYVSIFDGVVRDAVWRGEIEQGFTAWILRDIFYGALDYGTRTILTTDRRKHCKKFARELTRLVMREQSKSTTQSSISTNELSQLAARFENVVEHLEEKVLPKDQTK